MAGKIFINYRRGDDPGFTGRLRDRLEEAFGPECLFMDVDNIAPGHDFVRVLDEQVAQCDVLLAVIGKGWIDASDATGTRRLDNPDDIVRIEIESALKQDKLVIPVLVGEVQMPRPEQLPEAIRPLARRNKVQLTHERFHTDAQDLLERLQEALDDAEAIRQAKLDEARREKHPWLVATEEIVSALSRQEGHADAAPAWIKELKSPATRRVVLLGLRGAGLAAAGVGIIWFIRSQLPFGPSAPAEPPPPDLSIRTFTGTGFVSSVVFSPDGRTALSGGSDLDLWDVMTGERLRNFTMPDVTAPAFTAAELAVSEAVFSPDGRTALAAYNYGMLKLWEVASGKELRTFTGHTHEVTSVAFSPDGRTALSASDDKTLKLWQVAAGKELRTFNSDIAFSVAFSPDGRTALSSSVTLKLWQVATGKELRTFTGHAEEVYSVAF
jgi:hypothetical protein